MLIRVLKETTISYGPQKLRLGDEIALPSDWAHDLIGQGIVEEVGLISGSFVPLATAAPSEQEKAEPEAEDVAPVEESVTGETPKPRQRKARK